MHALVPCSEIPYLKVAFGLKDLDMHGREQLKSIKGEERNDSCKRKSCTGQRRRGARFGCFEANQKSCTEMFLCEAKQSTTNVFSIIQLLYSQTYLNVAVELLHSRSD